MPNARLTDEGASLAVYLFAVPCTAKEPRFQEGQLRLFLVTWAIVSPPRVWC